MPLYEYKCKKCGHRFEKIESFSSSTTKKCPKCGGTAERQVAAPAIQFKGSGWYVTDYAKKSSSPASSSESSDSGSKATDKSSETKATETKSTETKSSTGNEGSKKRKK